MSPSSHCESIKKDCLFTVDYLVEFLDTWLLLAEKMVHPKSVLDSVYPLPAKGNTSDYKPFNPTQYLKNILKVGKPTTLSY